jgi:DNA modification methylase
MPRKPSQPPLIREERAEYKVAPEEQARKEEYRARLKAFLEDPTSRQIEGFPIGENEDILALSDPPYYTACPNPFLAEIIEQWQKERPHPQPLSQRERGAYHREPFAADVSEGKNDPIYNAHSYHTKVPHKAIMRYILHYTEPGDIVFDGFCGTGMTGVAAQLCRDKKTVESLGYRVTDDGKIYDPGSPLPAGDREASRSATEGGRGGEGKLISHLGARKAVLNDLSPAATFIAYNYNTPVDIAAFEREARRILEEVEEECGWMYETLHTDGKTKGKINYTVWSDVYTCPACGEEMAFWDVAVEHEDNKVRDMWSCPSCKATLAKSPSKKSNALRAEHAFETFFDKAIGQTIRQSKQVPVLINYNVGRKRYQKRPDKSDISLLKKIEESEIPYSFPTYRMPEGDESRRNDKLGITHVHHFYTNRNLWVLAAINDRAKSGLVFEALWRLLFQSVSVILCSKLTRYNMGNRGNGPVSGTLYIASQIAEANVLKALAGKLDDFIKIDLPRHKENYIVECISSTNSLIPNNKVDYVFVDPPFGSNLMYSELNFLWETWLGVVSNNQSEAIVNNTQSKALIDYQSLMEECFREFCRALKPGHWMTVEFHNSANSVWNSIQEALQRAGFIIADVRTLDKQQGTFKQVNNSAAVKQDLIISAYKPNDHLEERFRLEAGTADGAWEFVRYHLTQLPRVVEKDDEIEVVAERQAFLLFDRMVAFHIQRGASVPLSAGEFYAGLKQKFVERDGMYFLPDQVAEYDAARLRLGRVAQLALFVSDEKSAIQWLRQQLDPALGGEPQTFADLQPKFMRGSNPAKHEQMPELGVILEQNFLEDERGNWYAPDPSKATDLERLRLKALLREFDEYVKSTGRLRQFRTEAVRAGFAEAYKKREYKVILDVAKRLPESVLHEDPNLLMYYDTATLRSEQ